jgi:hypothetical protein
VKVDDLVSAFVPCMNLFQARKADFERAMLIRRRERELLWLFRFSCMKQRGKYIEGNVVPLDEIEIDIDIDI